MIEPQSYDDPKLKQLIEILIEWINDELADQRIIVKDIEEDLYGKVSLQIPITIYLSTFPNVLESRISFLIADGQVLQKLLGYCRII